jgi:hypothetical protein
VCLVTDKDEFQRNRLGRGPRSVGCHGHRRLCRWIGPQSSATPARGKQGETDGCGVPYRAVEQDAGDAQGAGEGGNAKGLIAMHLRDESPSIDETRINAFSPVGCGFDRRVPNQKNRAGHLAMPGPDV